MENLSKAESKTCRQCEFCHKLKHFIYKEGMRELTACTYFPQTCPEDGYEAFALIIDAPDTEDVCEVFQERRNHDLQS